MAHKLPKVLILYNQLFHYRITIFNLLSQKCDLTVAYCLGPDPSEPIDFKTIRLTPIRLGKFVVEKENIYNICQQYDAVIAYGELAWLKHSTLPFRHHRNFKIAFWGIGVSASYNKHFDTVTQWDNIRDFFYKKVDAHVFYTDYPIDKYVGRGYEKSRLFVAPNTVAVETIESYNKSKLLFVGTLYKAKGIMSLLESYLYAYTSNMDIPNLDIIGDGPDFNEIVEWISNNNLNNKIILHGAIYDRKIKANFFAESLACISPKQAGLTVLESMGYGTTFITTKDAFTGGEIFNIKNKENGILLNDVDELSDIILDISNNREKYIKIGENARTDYLNCRKPSDMADGLYNSIKYMLNID